jgi:hypothetical protein
MYHGNAKLSFAYTLFLSPYECHSNSDFLPKVIHWVLFLIEVHFVVSDIGSEFINVTEMNFRYQKMNKL